jgi:hypothetical protein
VGVRVEGTKLPQAAEGEPVDGLPQPVPQALVGPERLRPGQALGKLLSENSPRRQIADYLGDLDEEMAA